MKLKVRFSHLWVSGFGWENTILSPEDFEEVELLGESEKDGKVYIAIQDNGKKQILKGYEDNSN